MGMFDELRCHYPLVIPGANDLLYQTKDTVMQFLDLYEIREDGTLWLTEYDIEDHSDPHATGLARFAGMCTRVNQRWVRVFESGAIDFYANHPTYGWIEFRANFDQGQLISLRQNLTKQSRE